MAYHRTGQQTGRPKGVGLAPSLINKVFGRLTVRADAPRDSSGQRRYICACICGGRTISRHYSLRSGKATSCGCVGKDRLAARSKTHGEFVGRRGVRQRTPEYQSWENMRQRCSDPNAKGYEHYGGRGIFVCARWQDSFQNFLSDMGRKPTPKHTIERNDVNGHYEPGNCRWATMSEQLKNRRPFLVVPKAWREKAQV